MQPHSSMPFIHELLLVNNLFEPGGFLLGHTKIWQNKLLKGAFPDLLVTSLPSIPSVVSTFYLKNGM